MLVQTQLKIYYGFFITFEKKIIFFKVYSYFTTYFEFFIVVKYMDELIQRFL